MPAAVTGRIGVPTVKATLEGKDVGLTATHVKHEVWGGKRFVNIQAESSEPGLVTKGAEVVWTFSVP